MTITLGNILTILGFLAAGIMAFSAMRGDMRLMNVQIDMAAKRLDAVTEQLRLLNSIVTDIAVQNARLETIEATIEDLKVGRGFKFNVDDMRSWARGMAEPNSTRER